MKTKKLLISIGMIIICILAAVIVSCNKKAEDTTTENSFSTTTSSAAELRIDESTFNDSTNDSTIIATDSTYPTERSRSKSETRPVDAETKTTQSDKTTRPTESDKSSESSKTTTSSAKVQRPPSSTRESTKPTTTTTRKQTETTTIRKPTTTTKPNTATKPVVTTTTKPAVTTKPPVATTKATKPATTTTTTTTKPASTRTTTKPATTTTAPTKPIDTTTNTTKPAEMTTTTTTKPPTTTTTTTQDPKVKYLDSKLMFVGEEYLWGEEDDGTKIYVRGTLIKTGKKANETINQAAFAKINEYRQSHGLNALVRDTSEQAQADRAASIIAARHVQLSLVGHVYSGYDAALTYIITYDMNNQEIGEFAAQAFIESPPHAEILRQKGTKISVATWIYDEPAYGETIALIISIR